MYPLIHREAVGRLLCCVLLITVPFHLLCAGSRILAVTSFCPVHAPSQATVDRARTKTDLGIGADVPVVIELKSQRRPTFMCEIRGTQVRSNNACTTNYYSCSLLGNLPVELVSPFLLLEGQQDLGNILGSVTR